MTRNIVVRRSPIHGTGIFAARDLPAGLTLIQYRGRLMTHAAADRMYDDTLDSGHTFLFTLNDRYILDGNFDSNSARYFNHSCSPNCQAVLYEDEGGDPKKDRIFIETKRAVRAGDELTYDYGIVLEVPHTARLKRIWACLCGKRNCTGTLLKPKRAPAAKQAAKQAGKKSAGKKVAVKKAADATAPRRARKTGKPAAKRARA